MPNEADALYDNITSFLRLTISRISPPSNENVNVGENFTLRFTLTNTAYPLNWASKPKIIFNQPFLSVSSTSFASFTGRRWQQFPDTQLLPGQQTVLDFEFTALQNLGGWLDEWVQEHVAKVQIWAKLDHERFFEVMKDFNVYEEIEPT